MNDMAEMSAELSRTRPQGLNVQPAMGVSRRSFLCLASLSLPAGLAAQSRVDVRIIQIFYRINEIRREHHLWPLEWDDRVEAAARSHALNMARRDFFDHDDPVLGDLVTRLGRAGVPWMTCAENIFEERGHRDLAAIAVEGWMNSPDHRENILHPRVTRTGLGLATRSDGSNWVDQIFIRPSNNRFMP